MKKKPRGTQAKNKYLDFMLTLHSLPTFNRRMIETEYKISHAVCTHLTKRGYIIQKATDQWHWIGNAPTMALVDSIRGSIYLDQQNCRQGKKTATKQLTIQPIKSIQRPVPQSIIELNEKISEYPILDVAIAFLAGMVVAAFFTLIWK
jgi:hypothetical protein